MENKIFEHRYFGDIYYLIDIPEKLKGKEKLPLLIFLHGAGERGHDYELLKKQGVPRYLSEGTMKNDSHIIVCPQCPAGNVWVGLSSMLKDFINCIINEYNADPSRVSITGISMGGYGTWEMTMLCPDMFKKAAPICGGGTPWRTQLIKADIRTFHGDADSVVPIENSYMMVEACKRNGKNIEFTVFPGVDHNSWDPAYTKTDLLKWLMDV